MNKRIFVAIAASFVASAFLFLRAQEAESAAAQEPSVAAPAGVEESASAAESAGSNVAEQETSAEPAKESKPLRPLPYYGTIAREIVSALQDIHVLRHQFDDEMSRRAWTNLVSFYDFDRSIFLKSDLDALAAHETTLDDELKDGDVSFGYEVYDLYCRRLKERIDFATNLLATGEWDLSSTTTNKYLVKRKLAEWPESKEAAEAHWRNRLRYEILAMTVNRELDAEEAAAEKAETAAEKAEEQPSGDGQQEGEAQSGEAAEGELEGESEGDPEEDAPKDEFDDDRDKTLTPQENLIKKYRQYVTVLAAPDEEYVMQSYMSAVCRAYDPHTDYMSPPNKEDFDVDMSLSFGGIGATLSMEDGALKIMEMLPDSPADKDGRIHVGDRIVGVGQGDGPIEDIMWQPIKKSIRKIRGPKDTRVTLEIVPASDRSGTTHYRYELVRDKITLDDLAATGRVEIIERADVTNKLGYVYLPSFYGTPDRRPYDEDFRSCTADVAKYLADFNAQDVEGLVLDLRGNGGGHLVEAIALSSRFVHSGPVVQVRAKSLVDVLPIPLNNAVSFRKPMVVLVDRVSASASEIVAAHLQDTGRALILGDSHTHGKGTVQTVKDLGPKIYGSIKVTTARFYRIDGRSTQIKGVDADLRLPSVLESLDIGEDKLDGALPFTKILKTRYAKCWNMDTYAEELGTLSAARLADDARYAKHLECVAGTKTVFDRETVPLDHDEFMEMARSDRLLREDRKGSAKDGKKRVRRRRRGSPDDDDVVLDEAFEVLSDLVRLNDGAELPRPAPNAYDWYNAIFGY